MKVCIVGASGKLGRYMVQHALDRGYEVMGLCREESVAKLDEFKGRITVVPGATNDPEVIKKAVSGCDGVLVVLVPRGVHGHSTGTAQAVLDPDYDHASWSENFPWTRLPGVVIPAQRKPPVEWPEDGNPGTWREALGDGSFGGLYQRSSENESRLWVAEVQAIRARLEAWEVWI